MSQPELSLRRQLLMEINSIFSSHALPLIILVLSPSICLKVFIFTPEIRGLFQQHLFLRICKQPLIIQPHLFGEIEDFLPRYLIPQPVTPSRLNRGRFSAQKPESLRPWKNSGQNSPAHVERSDLAAPTSSNEQGGCCLCLWYLLFP